MARPRRHPDSTIINAAADVIADKGSQSWSLDDVAQRTGMSPAALVKRFGSKRGLLRAVVSAWVDSIPEPPGAGIDDPLGALEAQVYRQFASIDATGASGHLGLLLAELQDDDLRALVEQGWRRQEAVYAGYLAAAQRTGLMRGPTLEEGGAMVMALTQGIALRWSVRPAGSLADTQRSALRLLIDGWR